MGLPIMCVKFLASRFLQFEGAESGTVSDHFYRNDVMSVDGFEKVQPKIKIYLQKTWILSDSRGRTSQL